MQKHKAVLSASTAAVAGIALAGLIWATNDNRATSEATGQAPAPEQADRRSAQAVVTVPSSEKTEASAPAPTPLQGGSDARAPVSAVPQSQAELRALTEANRDRLLSAQAQLQARIGELREASGAVPISEQELLRWAEVLYRDALLARLAHGRAEPSEDDMLRAELAATQLTLNPQDIPEPLPSAGDGYGRYLQQLLQALPQDGSTITDAQALDLALKIQGLLQRRKRHSDNLFLSDVRAMVLDASQPVAARIDYVQQFFDAGDGTLGQYGAALLADVPDRETLSPEDLQAIARLQARARQEKNQ